MIKYLGRQWVLELFVKQYCSDEWDASKCASAWTPDALQVVLERLPDLEARLCVKVLLSIFAMRKSQLQECEELVDKIAAVASEQPDGWQKLFGNALRDYAKHNAVNMENLLEHEGFRKLVDTTKRTLESRSDELARHHIAPVESSLFGAIQPSPADRAPFVLRAPRGDIASIVFPTQQRGAGGVGASAADRAAGAQPSTSQRAPSTHQTRAESSSGGAGAPLHTPRGPPTLPRGRGVLSHLGARSRSTLRPASEDLSRRPTSKPKMVMIESTTAPIIADDFQRDQLLKERRRREREAAEAEREKKRLEKIQKKQDKVEERERAIREREQMREDAKMAKIRAREERVRLAEERRRSKQDEREQKRIEREEKRLAKRQRTRTDAKRPRETAGGARDGDEHVPNNASTDAQAAVPPAEHRRAPAHATERANDAEVHRSGDDAHATVEHAAVGVEYARAPAHTAARSGFDHQPGESAANQLDALLGGPSSSSFRPPPRPATSVSEYPSIPAPQPAQPISPRTYSIIEKLIPNVEQFYALPAHNRESILRFIRTGDAVPNPCEIVLDRSTNETGYTHTQEVVLILGPDRGSWKRVLRDR